jgi:hypothetical protein
VVQPRLPSGHGLETSGGNSYAEQAVAHAKELWADQRQVHVLRAKAPLPLSTPSARTLPI